MAVVMRDADLPATLEFNRALVSSANGFPVTDSKGEVLHQYQYTLLGRNHLFQITRAFKAKCPTTPQTQAMGACDRNGLLDISRLRDVCRHLPMPSSMAFL